MLRLGDVVSRHGAISPTAADQAIATVRRFRLLGEAVFDKASDRSYLFASASRAMREVLIDHARQRASGRRGGGRGRQARRCVGQGGQRRGPRYEAKAALQMIGLPALSRRQHGDVGAADRGVKAGLELAGVGAVVALDPGPAQPQPVREPVRGAAVDDEHLVGGPGLAGKAHEAAPEQVALVAHGHEDGDR